MEDLSNICEFGISKWLTRRRSFYQAAAWIYKAKTGKQSLSFEESFVWIKASFESMEYEKCEYFQKNGFVKTPYEHAL